MCSKCEGDEEEGEDKKRLQQQLFRAKVTHAEPQKGDEVQVYQKKGAQKSRSTEQKSE